MRHNVCDMLVVVMVLVIGLMLPATSAAGSRGMFCWYQGTNTIRPGISEVAMTSTFHLQGTLTCAPSASVDCSGATIVADGELVGDCQRVTQSGKYSIEHLRPGCRQRGTFSGACEAGICTGEDADGIQGAKYRVSFTPFASVLGFLACTSGHAVTDPELFGLMVFGPKRYLRRATIDLGLGTNSVQGR